MGIERFGARESTTERAISNAEEALWRIIETNPELGQYAPPSNRTRAAYALRDTSALLRANPYLLDVLREATSDDPAATTMLVIPGLPLILTDTGDSITALAPVLSCTRKAIETAFPTSSQLPYGIVSSHGELDAAAIMHALTKPGQSFNFDPGTMNPVDYMSLAVNAFYNETFRLQFAKGDPTFTPLAENFS